MGRNPWIGKAFLHEVLILKFRQIFLRRTSVEQCRVYFCLCRLGFAPIHISKMDVDCFYSAFIS